MKKIKCPECKKKLSAKAVMCPKCGCPISDVQKSEDSTVGESLNISNVEESAMDKKLLSKFRFTYLWIAIAIVVIGIATFCIYKGVFSKGLSPNEIYELAEPTTVEIQVKTAYGQGIGTGFFVDGEGTIVTNYHVIENGYEGVAILKNVGKFEIKEIIGYDESLDVAILKIDYKSEKFLEKRIKQIEVGETVYALGSSEGLTNSFSSGTISALDRQFDGNHYIQVTAPISHGNSGGPLIDKNGKVIGITSAGIEDGQNLNLVIPITAIDLVDKNLNYEFRQFFILEARNGHTKTLEEIKQQGFIYFFGIKQGEYQGTVHSQDCPLILSIRVNKEDVDAFWDVFPAFDEGYIVCPECKCVFSHI